MEKKCCICKGTLDSENAAILTISGYAVPKYICRDCEDDFDCATQSTDTTVVYGAMDRLGKKLLASGTDDEIVLSEVGKIMSEADARAKAIDEGTCDFSEEESEDTVEFSEMSDVADPFEEEETEEDIEQARLEAERAKKIEKITNIICIGIIVVAVAFFTYWTLKRIL